MPRRGARPLFALLALGAVALGACRGGGGSGGSGTTVDLADTNKAASAAVERTLAPGTVRFEMRYDSAQGSATTTVSGDGEFDFDADVGHINVKIADQATELIVTRDTIYGKLSGALASGKKPWLSFPTGDGTTAASAIDQVVQLADPRKSLARLPLATQMKRIGTETVRGTSTVHFRGIVDLSDASVAKLPKADQAPARDFRQRLGAQSHPIDLWLDPAGRVRRYESELAGKEGDQAVTVKTHIDLFAYGDKVTVIVPPASQVQDAASYGRSLSSTTVP